MKLKVNQTLDSMYSVFQAIKSGKTQEVYGYESLLRYTVKGFESPIVFIREVEKQKKMKELNFKFRSNVREHIQSLPKNSKIFLNIQPFELDDLDTLGPKSPLFDFSKSLALEVSERATLCTIKNVESKIEQLKDWGYQIAIDDLGSGHSDLSSFTFLKPDICKIDMSLIRGVHLDLKKEKIVQSILDLCRKLGIMSICEGVEFQEEKEKLLQMNADYMQGFLLGKPQACFQL